MSIFFITYISGVIATMLLSIAFLYSFFKEEKPDPSPRTFSMDDLSTILDKRITYLENV